MRREGAERETYRQRETQIARDRERTLMYHVDFPNFVCVSFLGLGSRVRGLSFLVQFCSSADQAGALSSKDVEQNASSEKK